MNDDLKLVLGCYAEGVGLTRIAINIPHGYNDSFWRDNYKYFGETITLEAYKKLLPLHCQDMVEEILFIDECFEIVG